MSNIEILGLFVFECALTVSRRPICERLEGFVMEMLSLFYFSNAFLMCLLLLSGI